MRGDDLDAHAVAVYVSAGHVGVLIGPQVVRLHAQPAVERVADGGLGPNRAEGEVAREYGLAVAPGEGALHVAPPPGEGRTRRSGDLLVAQAAAEREGRHERPHRLERQEGVRGPLAHRDVRGRPGPGTERPGKRKVRQPAAALDDQRRGRLPFADRLEVLDIEGLGTLPERGMAEVVRAADAPS